ncbi:MAG: methyltransferase domain-containing protein [Pseudomonadales bacterium]|nr:methyltransferase domain-containing protein [Pseudomonadales bacterium]
MFFARKYPRFISASLACAALISVSAPALSAAADVAAALSHPDRPSADVADDASRKPAQVLSFAGLETGMSVFEMEAGGGYYTEILARAVGPNGSVVMQNPPSFDDFIGDAPQVRTANGRLPNIRISRTNFDQLEAADNSIDLVTWILGPHELGFVANGVSLGDASETFNEIARILKPGGLLLAVDHIAPAGSGIEAGGTLHRVAESVVTELATAAGLTFYRSSDLHKNPADPLTIGVFDPSIQGNTSKFVVLYRK